jgi:hypothetical protein
MICAQYCVKSDGIYNNHLALKDKHGGGEKDIIPEDSGLQGCGGVLLGEGYPTFLPQGLGPISQKVLYLHHHLSQNLRSPR